MEIEMKIKIKLNEKKTIELNEAEAREIFFKLKEIYDTNNVTYIPITYPRLYPQVTYEYSPRKNPYEVTC